MRISLAIFDFNRTLFDPELGEKTKGATDVLKYVKAKDINVCIVSRKEGERREVLIREQEFSKFADRIYFVDTDDKFLTFKRAIEEFGVLSREAVVIGDYLEKDIEPAIRLGCRTIWLRNGKFAELTPELTNVYPEYEVTTLEEVINII